MIAMNQGARVIVGVDGSLSSLAALQRGLAEARSRNALLVPVTAWMACDGDSLRPLSELEYAARLRLDSIVEMALDGAAQGIRVQPRTVCSAAGRALVALADRPQDLLVVGGGRHSGTRNGGVLHGPVTRYCWARADCEVIIVPANHAQEVTPRTGVTSDDRDEENEQGVAVHCHAGVGYLN
jgi:nucleotide-binding universal stress UspA family protein